MADLTVPTLHAEKVINIAGIPITNSIIGTWLAIALLLLFVYFATRRPQLVPRGAQNMLEVIVEQFQGLVRDVTESESNTRKYLPLVVGIFLFVLFLNWVALVPGVGTIGGKDAAGMFIPAVRAGSSDLNMTLAIAAVSFLTAQLAGFTVIGIVRYSGKFIVLGTLFKKPFSWKNLALFVPNFLLGLIELISEIAKLISLSFRLFGNIYAGEVLLTVFATLLPLFIPVSAPFYLLEVFVGVIQAFVFAMLTIVFIKIATLEPEH